jgi:hypothetical protein
MFETASWREHQRLEGGEHSADLEVADEVVRDVGAYIMGRKMFGGGDGPWDKTWTSCGSTNRLSMGRSSCSRTTHPSHRRCFDRMLYKYYDSYQ